MTEARHGGEFPHLFPALLSKAATSPRFRYWDLIALELGQARRNRLSAKGSFTKIHIPHFRIEFFVAFVKFRLFFPKMSRLHLPLWESNEALASQRRINCLLPDPAISSPLHMLPRPRTRLY